MRTPKFTSDRYYPERYRLDIAQAPYGPDGDALRAERRLGAMLHEGRYEWAVSQIVGSPNAVDLGCGCGYGTVKLCDVCTHVTGIDHNVEAIIWAKQRYSRPNVDYVQIEIEQWVPERQMEVGVLFEVLDRVSRPYLIIHRVFNWGIKRLLASVPRGSIGEDEHGLRDLLDSYFDVVTIYAQHTNGHVTPLHVPGDIAGYVVVARRE